MPEKLLEARSSTNIKKSVRPYSADKFLPENVDCFLHLLHISKYTSDYF